MDNNDDNNDDNDYDYDYDYDDNDIYEIFFSRNHSQNIEKNIKYKHAKKTNYKHTGILKVYYKDMFLEEI